MATTTISSSAHDSMVHTAELDYYGRRLATGSSDRSIRVFSIEPSAPTTANTQEASQDTHRLTATLTAHESAVWSVAWSSPKFGTILASSGYDGRVIIHRESQPSASQQQQQQQQSGAGGRWEKIYEFTLHTASVNLVAWSPAEIGCHLAAASSDGNVSVLTFENNSFSHVIFPAHGMGVNSVSWAPATLPGALTSAGTGAGELQRRLVTGGSDSMVKIWSYNATAQSYDNVATLKGHGDWVRDVAWSPSPLSKTYVASASQDRSVRIWTLPAGGNVEDSNAWKCETLEFEVVVWRVSWSMSGNVLAVAGGDNRVSLWKEKLKGGWQCIKTIDE
ncbi:GTPase-activating protein S13 [Elasticomyces elasticus]|uniref:Protein transport protein SEC13 n=1 Tax=Elasticomyces elasticus TaxID=574655 RepID=A0AAN7VNZ5_9PEZI|nr:GTPase-activating protein S13 [Elasticomyces elasticus]